MRLPAEILWNIASHCVKDSQSDRARSIGSEQWSNQDLEAQAYHLLNVRDRPPGYAYTQQNLEHVRVMVVQILAHHQRTAHQQRNDTSTALIPDYKTLNHLCQASRQLAGCCTPLLYRTLVLRDISDTKKLMATLASNPDICSHILYVILQRPTNFEGDTLQLFDQAQIWIKNHYSAEFAHEMRSTMRKRPQAPESMLALILILAPNVKELSWARGREPKAVKAVFRKSFVTSHSVPDTSGMILQNLRVLDYVHRSDDILTRRWSSMSPFFFITGLEHLTVTGVCLLDASYFTPTNSELDQSQRCAQLRSLTIVRSVVSRDVLEQILKVSTQLQTLTMIDCLKIPHETMISLEDLGHCIRRGANQLRKLHLEQGFYRSNTNVDEGCIGSLQTMISLEEIFIDPAYVAGHNYSTTKLWDALPTNLTCITLHPKSRFSGRLLLDQLSGLMRDHRFVSLSKIVLTLETYDLIAQWQAGRDIPGWYIPMWDQCEKIWHIIRRVV